MKIKERGILFKAEMVRALLRDEDPKTQTRRIVKPQPTGLYAKHAALPAKSDKPSPYWYFHHDIEFERWQQVRCPYGVPGDRLWVRETTWYDVRDKKGCVIYVADDAQFYKYRVDRRGPRVQRCDPGHSNTMMERHKFWKKRPSIHMPRWASRILLEITNIRMQRVQEINDADALAEGIVRRNRRGFQMDGYGLPEWREDECNITPRGAFLHLFYGINKRASIKENPYVWVIEFKRVKQR